MGPYTEVKEFIKNLDLLSNTPKEATLMQVMVVYHVGEQRTTY